MAEKESQNFRFRIDEMNPDTLFQDEMGQQRVDKLSQRVTIISILVPCLVGIMLFLGYLQIKQNMSGIQNTGADQVKQLSTEVQTRFDNIEAGQTRIENALTLKVSKLEKEVLFIKENLKKTDLQLSKAQKTLGTANRNLSEVKSATVTKDAFLEVSQKIAALEDYISAELSQKLTRQKKEMEQYMVQQLEKTSNSIDALKTELGDLSEIKMDRKELALTLLNEQQRFQERLDKNSRQVKKEVEGLKPNLQKLQFLEHQIQEIKEALHALQARATTSPSPVQPSATSPPPPLPTSAQVSEQDLRQ